MNRKQWLVLGFGMIVMGIFFGFMNVITSEGCDEITADYVDIMDKMQQSEMTIEEKGVLMSSYDLVESCQNKGLMFSMINTIFWGFGIIFVIIGFLEKKAKKRRT